MKKTRALKPKKRCGNGINASTLIELTAGIVASHASMADITSEELVSEIQKVHTALKQLAEGGAVVQIIEQAAEKKTLIVAKKSIQKKQIVCLVCGKGGFKTLTRHLNQVHNIKPAEYRKLHGLPSGTPLASKAYSEQQRAVAIKHNLGEKLAKGRDAVKAKLKMVLKTSHPVAKRQKAEVEKIKKEKGND